MQKNTLDRHSSEILSILQEDSTTPLGKIADQIGLSVSACHRRIKTLEREGIIDGFTIRLNPQQMGYNLTIFVEIVLMQQSEATLRAFEDAVCMVPEILECHLLNGHSDYFMRVSARDNNDFERIHREKLTRLPGVSRIVSNISLRTVVDWRGYHIAIAQK
ncbi:MAG: Lrp/AsnC family transcriptional regulator [Pseudomonadota bacterium]